MITYMHNEMSIGQYIMQAHDTGAVEDPYTVFILAQIPESEAVEFLRDLIAGLIDETTVQTFVERIIEIARNN